MRGERLAIRHTTDCLALRKRFLQGVQFDFNYTLSKSIDLSSDSERITPWGGLGGQIINSWDYKALRAVFGFDVRHQITANWVAEVRSDVIERSERT